MTVLIVDDTSILRRILSDILVEFCKVPRHNISEAVDGMQAVAEFKRTNPDVVFLDIAMPKLSGQDVVKKILEINRNAKIIMCTSVGNKAMVEECIRNGAKDYLLKPLQPDRVERAIRKATQS
jgi:two-component system chemotaxis response regulator CheY